jgi:hypothetical protein
MVNPYVGGLLDPKSISIGGKDILADDIANNYIFLLPNKKVNSDELREILSAE